MYRYRISGQNINFSDFLDGMLLFEIGGLHNTDFVYLSSSDILIIPSLPDSVHTQTQGWIGGINRQFEIWSTRSGVLLRVDGCGDCYISPDGQSVIKVDDLQKSNHLSISDKQVSSLSSLDREILLGPALVLALALRGTWSLHCSAAVFGTQAFVFLGETGQGKSTLASYLSGGGEQGWRLLADDILPVTLDVSGLTGWPHFPQLKLPPDAQPGSNWPEQVPIGKVCVLISAEKDDEPYLRPLPRVEAIRVLLSHTAGTRLFDDALLEKHLSFCAQAVEHVLVYQLIYPHSRDALPKIRKMLENLC